VRRSALLAMALAAAAAAVGGSSIEYVEEGGGRVVAEALGYLGVPYRLAGTDTGGVDCSGSCTRSTARLRPRICPAPSRA